MDGKSHIPIVRVFVSSTSLDLQPERAAIQAVINGFRETKFEGMEYFGSNDASAAAESVARVRDAALVVLVLGGRHGSGITMEEYRKSQEEPRLPCLVYLKDENAIPPEFLETDPAKAETLRRFREEVSHLRDGHLAAIPFTSTEQLARSLALDLHKWLVDAVLRPWIDAAVGRRDVAGLRAVASATRHRDVLRDAVADGRRGDPLDFLAGRIAEETQEELLAGIRSLPTDFGARIRNFLVEYLGTQDHPVPFGGRDQVLGELDAWLADETAPPYMLVSAGAGAGKSAVVVRWTRRLLLERGVRTAFVPVSIRFRTNLASVVFPALAARTADLHGGRASAGLDASVEVWRGIFSEWLARPIPEGERVVVVLDALDEAADWSAAADLFPLDPPRGLRVVVSARHTAKHADPESWLAQLGWHREGLARSLVLGPLDRDGIGDVLERFGCPLDTLATNVDVLTELHRLTEGDPLLVRLYVEDLWKRGQNVLRLRPEDLRTIEPGLDGYFKRWWKEQLELWGDAAPLLQPGVTALLRVFTVARGPLLREDVLELVPARLGLDSDSLEAALEPVARFLTGDGERSGFVFSHPRFGAYRYDRLTEGERKETEEAFLDWGRRTVERLVKEELAPPDVPAYLVSYLGSHLERARRPVGEFMALLTEPWKKAWEALEGGLAGFSGDVERAWRAAVASNDRAVREGRRPAHLADVVLCALCRASIRSLQQNISPVLLGRMVEFGIWSADAALAYARSLDDPARRCDALLRAATCVPAGRRAKVELEAVEAARAARLSSLSAWTSVIEFMASPPADAGEAWIAATGDGSNLDPTAVRALPRFLARGWVPLLLRADEPAPLGGRALIERLFMMASPGCEDVLIELVRSHGVTVHEELVGHVAIGGLTRLLGHLPRPGRDLRARALVDLARLAAEGRGSLAPLETVLAALPDSEDVPTHMPFARFLARLRDSGVRYDLDGLRLAEPAPVWCVAILLRDVTLLDGPSVAADRLVLRALAGATAEDLLRRAGGSLSLGLVEALCIAGDVDAACRSLRAMRQWSIEVLAGLTDRVEPDVARRLAGVAVELALTRTTSFTLMFQGAFEKGFDRIVERLDASEVRRCADRARSIGDAALGRLVQSAFRPPDEAAARAAARRFADALARSTDFDDDPLTAFSFLLAPDVGREFARLWVAGEVQIDDVGLRDAVQIVFIAAMWLPEQRDAVVRRLFERLAVTPRDVLIDRLGELRVPLPGEMAPAFPFDAIRANLPPPGSPGTGANPDVLAWMSLNAPVPLRDEMIGRLEARLIDRGRLGDDPWPIAALPRNARERVRAAHAVVNWHVLPSVDFALGVADPESRLEATLATSRVNPVQFARLLPLLPVALRTRLLDVCLGRSGKQLFARTVATETFECVVEGEDQPWLAQMPPSDVMRLLGAAVDPASEDDFVLLFLFHLFASQIRRAPRDQLLSLVQSQFDPGRLHTRTTLATALPFLRDAIETLSGETELSRCADAVATAEKLFP